MADLMNSLRGLFSLVFFVILPPHGFKKTNQNQRPVPRNETQFAPVPSLLPLPLPPLSRVPRHHCGSRRRILGRRTPSPPPRIPRDAARHRRRESPETPHAAAPDPQGCHRHRRGSPRAWSRCTRQSVVAAVLSSSDLDLIPSTPVTPLWPGRPWPTPSQPTPASPLRPHALPPPRSRPDKFEPSLDPSSLLHPLMARFLVFSIYQSLASLHATKRMVPFLQGLV
mgnify:CR=1 FL=1